MGQSGAVGRTEKRTDSCRCAGGLTKKYRRPDRPKRVVTLDSAGVSATAFIGRAKEEKFWELKHGTHTQAGQDKETCPNLHLIGEVLHLSIPPNPIPAQAQKKNAREKQAKKRFF